MSLTPAQRDALAAIERHMAAHGGSSPTIRQLGQALGLRSSSSVQRLLLALEDRGFIARRPNRACGISLVKRADAPGRSAHDLTPELLAMLEGVMWAASTDRHEGGLAPGCSFCGAERPSNVAALCRCELGRLVARGRAAVAQGPLPVDLRGAA